MMMMMMAGVDGLERTGEYTYEKCFIAKKHTRARIILSLMRKINSLGLILNVNNRKSSY